MPDSGKVTIVIATHNNVGTIEKCLRSVTVGIRPANKVMVGDDDSKDGTYAKLCELLGAQEIEKDGQVGLPPKYEAMFNGVEVCVFIKRKSTLAHTANTAMKMSPKDTAIFGFVDPASWYAPDKIGQAIRVFRTHPSVACVISDCDNQYDDGVVKRIFRPSFDMPSMYMGFQYDKNFLIRTQILPVLGRGFDEQFDIREEYDFLLRIAKVGLLYHIPAPLHTNAIQDIDGDTQKRIDDAEQRIRKIAYGQQHV